MGARSVCDDPGLELHWGGVHDDSVEGRTGLVDTLLLLGGCVSDVWFVAAMDAALHRP